MQGCTRRMLHTAGGPRRIIFLGAPGVGKGTFANLLAPLIKVPTISTGDVIRKHVKLQTPAGKVMKVGAEIRVRASGSVAGPGHLATQAPRGVMSRVNMLHFGMPGRNVYRHALLSHPRCDRTWGMRTIVVVCFVRRTMTRASWCQTTW